MARSFLFRGRAWKLGDNIDTDVIIAGRYQTLTDLDKMASHVLEAVLPDFAKKVSRGDVLVAGRNFGCGSSRESAPLCLKRLGIGAVIAESFARIYFRNAVNIGLPSIECKGISSRVEESNELEVDLKTGLIRNITRNETYEGTRLPDFLLEIIEAGGALEALAKRLKR